MSVFEIYFQKQCPWKTSLLMRRTLPHYVTQRFPRSESVPALELYFENAEHIKRKSKTRSPPWMNFAIK